MATYNLIESKVLASGTASITFTSIPQTYTDLLITCGLRIDGTATDVFSVKPNGQTGTFATVNVQGYGNNSTVFSGSTSLIAGGAGASGYSTNVVGNASIYFFNYTNSLNKSISIDSSPGNYAAPTRIVLTNGYWNTSSPITSIEIAALEGGTLQVGSSLYLYGIKNF